MLVGPHLPSSGKDHETNNIGYNESNYSKVQELLIQDQTDDSLQIKAEFKRWYIGQAQEYIKAWLSL